MTITIDEGRLFSAMDKVSRDALAKSRGCAERGYLNRKTGTVVFVFDNRVPPTKGNCYMDIEVLLEREQAAATIADSRRDWIELPVHVFDDGDAEAFHRQVQTFLASHEIDAVLIPWPFITALPGL